MGDAGDRHQPRRGLRDRQALASRTLRRSRESRGAGTRAPPSRSSDRKSERELCASDRRRHRGPVHETSRAKPRSANSSIMAAACRVYLTNDSGAMHIASALGVPTVAIFGATDDLATGPTGPLARVVREPVECSPCLKRECPIDHRCMTRVSAARVAEAALEPAQIVEFGYADQDRLDAKKQPGSRHRGATVVSGYFDPMLASHAQRLAKFKTRRHATAGPDRDSGQRILPARARAELVAALAVVDHVAEFSDDLAAGTSGSNAKTPTASQDLIEHVHRAVRAPRLKTE